MGENLTLTTNTCISPMYYWYRGGGGTGIWTTDSITYLGSVELLKPEIKKVIFNPPATVVIWQDGTKTVVKCSENDIFDPEKGLAMAIVKKMYGNSNSFHKIFKRWISK